MVFGQLINDLLTMVGFVFLVVIPNAFYNFDYDITVGIHGDDFTAEGEAHSLDWLYQVLANTVELKRVGRIGPGFQQSGKILKRLVLEPGGIYLGGGPSTGSEAKRHDVA